MDENAQSKVGGQRDGNEAAPDSKRPFVTPKLSFVEPKLTRHGGVTDTTAAFIGSFEP